MLSLPSFFRKYFRKKMPVYWFVITIVFLVAYNFVKTNYVKSDTPQFKSNYSPAPVNADCISVLRLKDYDLIKPMVLAEVNCESEKLQGIKSTLNDVINKELAALNIISASVYLKKLNEVGGASINKDEKYNPGSMMKLVVMIAYLSQADDDPSLLRKRMTFQGKNSFLPVEEKGIPTSLITGSNYSVKELIELMIIDSDNEAMALLVNNIDRRRLNKLYADLNIIMPEENRSEFFMTTVDYGKLLRVLYNSTYLSRKNSEYALTVLCKAKYNKGLTRNLPESIKVAHKYGIAGMPDYKYLSEAAIVFLGNNPYLLVIMTKGSDFNKQSDFISNISDLVFHQFSLEANS